MTSSPSSAANVGGGSVQPSSPTPSFYAVSDADDGHESEYGAIAAAHRSTGRGVKLLFSKSKVYVHPTRSERDNIAGYIALLQQKRPSRNDDSAVRSTTSPPAGSSAAPPAPGSHPKLPPSDLLLAWVPESALGDAESIYVKVDMSEGDSPPRQSYLVAPPPTITSHTGVSDGYAFAIPLSAVFSLQVRPPNPGWFHGSVIINSRLGATFPPLFFHDNECQSTILQKRRRTRENFDPFGEAGEAFWGGLEVVKWIKRYVHVERSAAEPTIYLVEPTREDSKAFGSKGPAADAAARSAGPVRQSAAGNRPASTGSTSAVSAEPFMKMVRDARWTLMERLSRVTTLTRRAAEDALDNPNLPPQVRRLIRNPEVQTVQEEFESARVYLARWALGLQEQSERERGQRLWTARDVLDLEESDVGQFEILDCASSVTLADRRRRVTAAEWRAWFDGPGGRLSVTPDEVKERIFHGGLDPDDGVRAEAWLFLLGVYGWDSSVDERKAQAASLRDHYYRLKSAWWERLENMGGDDDEGENWREQRNRIEKDVHRTDRNVAPFAGDNIPHPDPNSPFADIGTNVHLEQLKEMLLTYNEFNQDLGYVQGMSDLLAPVYAVVQDDAVAFWAFERFMDRMERNFLRDQTGMRAQLQAIAHLVRFMDPALYAHLDKADSTEFFVFFRMIIVWYKREFVFPDVLRLWEVLWTDYLTSSFHLFIAMAILEKHRDVIIDHLRTFDEVLKYVNELNNTMDLDEVLIRAESLFRRFKRMVEAVDKKNNFPTARSGGKASPPGKGKDTAQDGDAAAAAAIVTPELRGLLSRQVAGRQPKAPGKKAVEVQVQTVTESRTNTGRTAAAAVVSSEGASAGRSASTS